MKPWKAVLGLGAACAACCAGPLRGVVGGLASFGAALAACAGELLLAMVVLAAVLVLSAARQWRRRRAALASASVRGPWQRLNPRARRRPPGAQ